MLIERIGRELNKQQLLQEARFGARVAEEESQELEQYFVETDQWRRIFEGDVDIVYGPKGSGKSALYSLLLARKDELAGRGIEIIPAENIRGAPIFGDLVQDPPTTEREFIGLWKLYFLSLVGMYLFTSECSKGKYSQEVLEALQQAGLVKEGLTLQGALQNAFGYVRSVFRPEAVEGKMSFDPHTGLPNGFGGEITFKEVSPASYPDLKSVHTLLGLSEKALAECNKSTWILLDRLDVAFAEAQELEENALRALFRVYLDLLGFERIHPKIFLRTDIMGRIMETGFREASHITRHLSLTWDKPSLLNLIVLRILQNDLICEYYNVNPEEVLASMEGQEELFYRIFPRQVDVGQKMPQTFDWMVSRISDGTGQAAPRELIHLLNSGRERQLRLLELGNQELEGEALFSRGAIKQSLAEVSKVRLEQTLYAEYPELRGYIENLRRKRTQQHPESLAKIWGTDEKVTDELATRLSDIGFF